MSGPDGACPRCGYERLAIVDDQRRCSECGLTLDRDSIIVATRSPVELMFSTPLVLIGLGLFWSWILIRLWMVTGWFPVVSGVFWILVFVAGFMVFRRRRMARGIHGAAMIVVAPDGVHWWRGGQARHHVPWRRIRRWSIDATRLGRPVKAPAGAGRHLLTVHGRSPLVRRRVAIEEPPVRVEQIRAAMDAHAAAGGGD